MEQKLEIIATFTKEIQEIIGNLLPNNLSADQAKILKTKLFVALQNRGIDTQKIKTLFDEFGIALPENSHRLFTKPAWHRRDIGRPPEGLRPHNTKTSSDENHRVVPTAPFSADYTP